MGIPFATSRRSTLGIEWELLLIDRDSGELRQCAQTILDAVQPSAGNAHPKIVQELLLNTVEIITGICDSVAEAGRDITASFDELRAVADPLRVDLISSGTHPFSRWMDQKVTDKQRYSTLIDRTQWWGRQMQIYGVHYHVGVERREHVWPIINALLHYLPHLQALSASSPLWMGERTGYASNRALLFQQLPTAGLPYQFDEWHQYESYVADMMKTGVIDVINEIRWDIRPSPSNGTIEVRVCDGLPTLREVLALAALVQCLVDDMVTRLDAGETLPRIQQWHVQENKWRTARYGMEAIIILDAEGNERLVTDDTADLIERLKPVAERLGCADELADVGLILAHGASYERQLRVLDAHRGTLTCVVDALQHEMAANTPNPR
ncbi:glutamate--cysteine ligase [Micrococcales bacterium 31B]|nr:glutamate--cysteine ligase [Micrococcales bacterium 31B]